MIKPNKVCPVLINNKGDDLLILAFRHPLGDYQLVKGTIEINEAPETAALRELSEESGIDYAHIINHLGIWESGYNNRIGTFYLCGAAGLTNKWIYHTQDDGGLDFAFFWHSLSETPDTDWHPLFQGALQWIKDRIMPARTN